MFGNDASCLCEFAISHTVFIDHPLKGKATEVRIWIDETVPMKYRFLEPRPKNFFVYELALQSIDEGWGGENDGDLVGDLGAL